MKTTHQGSAKIFKAFCDEHRLGILEMLRSGEKCACVLLEQLGIGQSTLSYHMKILCESGIIESRQDGKWTHYKISQTGSAYAIALMQTLTTAASDSETSVCG